MKVHSDGPGYAKYLTCVCNYGIDGVDLCCEVTMGMLVGLLALVFTIIIGLVILKIALFVLVPLLGMILSCFFSALVFILIIVLCGQTTLAFLRFLFRNNASKK